MASVAMACEMAPLNPPKDEGGKRSKIYEYCNRPERKGQKCIWFCRRYGRSTFAEDVTIEEIEEGADPYQLQHRFDKWWNRFGFFNIVGVRHVQIKFPISEKEKHGFPVIVNIVNHIETASTIRASWRKLKLCSISSMYCVPNIYGERHTVEGPFFECPNYVKADDQNAGGCKIHRRRLAEVYVDTLEWTPTLLDHYWEHGIEGAGAQFLENGRFVVSYEYLAYDQFRDAEDPYGKSIYALELVKGWRIRRLLWTMLAAIVVDICIVAIVTLLTGSGETGLAAGSYAVAIEALLIALLTLLSALVQ